MNDPNLVRQLVVDEGVVHHTGTELANQLFI
jgi:hypothetical protein